MLFLWRRISICLVSIVSDIRATYFKVNSICKYLEGRRQNDTSDLSWKYNDIPFNARKCKWQTCYGARAGCGPGSGPIWSKKLPNFLCLFDTKPPTEIELLAWLPELSKYSSPLSVCSHLYWAFLSESAIFFESLFISFI